MSSNNKRRKPLLSCSKRQIRRIIASNDHQSSLLTDDNSIYSKSSSSSDNNDEIYKPLQSFISQTVSNNLQILTNDILSNNNDYAINDDLADSFASDSSSDPLVLSDKDSNLSPSHNNNSVLNELNKSIQHLEEFESSLRVWAMNNNITHSALSQLLVILNNHTYHNLPLDARTLLKTSRLPLYNLTEIGNGSFWYYGLEKCILNMVEEQYDVDTLELLINIDGLPIAKSSNSSIWPILCSDTKFKKVFMIGAYYGHEKPIDSNMYLEQFVNEIVPLVQNGFKMPNNKLITIKMHGLICDAPAKSFVLCTKGHTGYYSCSKCIIKGSYINNRICFPLYTTEIEDNGHSDEIIGFSDLRTDLEFKNNDYADTYQHSISILNNIPQFGLISNVPLDYMHLVCLGVIKKMINLWISGPLPIRMLARDIKIISDKLIDYQKTTPNDFSRKPRSLYDYKHFKATELRNFLLYTGPIVLKNYLQNNLYTNFIVLHVSITILINPNYCTNNTFIVYAKKLLIKFVLGFQKLYGEENVSHNVHNLLHLADDVQKYGALDEFSAFRFENHMSSIKKMLRKSERPLQQLAKRYSERENIVKLNNTKLIRQSGLKKLHTSGPLTNSISTNKTSVIQYKQYTSSKLSIICDGTKNCFCLLNDNVVVFVQNIVKFISSDKIYICGYDLKPLTPYSCYTIPCSSTDLNIKIVSGIGKNQTLHIWPIDTIKAKIWLIPFKEKYIAVPIIHSYT